MSRLTLVLPHGRTFGLLFVFERGGRIVQVNGKTRLWWVTLSRSSIPTLPCWHSVFFCSVGRWSAKNGCCELRFESAEANDVKWIETMQTKYDQATAARKEGIMTSVAAATTVVFVHFVVSDFSEIEITFSSSSSSRNIVALNIAQSRGKTLTTTLWSWIMTRMNGTYL